MLAGSLSMVKILGFDKVLDLPIDSRAERDRFTFAVLAFPTVKFMAPPGLEMSGPAAAVGVLTEKLPPSVFGKDGTLNDPAPSYPQ